MTSEKKTFLTSKLMVVKTYVLEYNYSHVLFFYFFFFYFKTFSCFLHTDKLGRNYTSFLKERASFFVEKIKLKFKGLYKLTKYHNCVLQCKRLEKVM